MSTRPAPMFLIAAANALVGLELTSTHARTGALDSLLREVNGEGDATHAVRRRPRVPFFGPRPTWDAAFTHHVGYWSHYDDRGAGSTWPLPPAPTAAKLGEVARERGLLELEPLPGDLFLLYNPSRKEFVRTGIVVHVERDGEYTTGGRYHECVVIEGDTDGERSFRGGEVLRHQRKLSADQGDRFIRWVAAKAVAGGDDE